MKQVFLYIYCYNHDLLRKYFSLMLDGEKVFDETDIEKFSSIFEKLGDKGCTPDNTEWCILCSANVDHWEFDRRFSKHGFTPLKPMKISAESVCKIMSENYRSVFILGTPTERKQKQIKILYPTSAISSDTPIETKNSNVELIKKAEEILESDGKKKTELARLINEIFNEMKGSK